MLLALGIGCFLVAQGLAWLQINGQFINEWCKKNTLLLSLLGVPISYFFIWGTGFIFEALDGRTWPGRLLTFAVGIIVFTVFANVFLGESVNLKTAISLILTLIIILIQVL
jgi:hypothetical protein